MNEEVERTLRSDPTMASLVDRHGRLTVEPADDAFRRLCVSILNQQLSTASATAIRERDLTREGFSGVDDAAVLTELTSITGIGGWTARMYKRYKATAPGLDPGVEADNTQSLIQLSMNK